MRKAPPSTIQLHYDYQRMSPSSTTHTIRNDANYYDNQYTSLFGDPVPPPTDEFLHNLDNHLYGNFRRASFATATPDDDRCKAPIFMQIRDERPRPAQRSSGQGKQENEALNSTYRVYESLVTPRLGPDIRLLPDSGGSSSDVRESPTFIHLDSERKPSMTNAARNQRRSSTTSQQPAISSTTCPSRQRYMDCSRDEKTARTQCEKSSELRDTKDSELRSRTTPNEPVRYHRQISNESYSSNDWFRPIDMPEFSKIPRMRPSSKNVMSIKHDRMQQDSPVATLLRDSNESSSGEDRLVRDENLEPPREQYVPQVRQVRKNSATETEEHSSARDQYHLPHGHQVRNNSQTKPRRDSQPEFLEPGMLGYPRPTEITPSGRAVSPVIITEAITTGADYRVHPHRPHKKTSFTIISDRSPQSSRAQSPNSNHPSSSGMSSFHGRGFKEPTKPPIAMPRSAAQKPVPSAAHLKLPTIGPNSNNLNTSDESPRPSVQFNMSSFPTGHSGAAGQELPAPKGILQQKQHPSKSTSTTLPLVGSLPHKYQSCEALPLITDPLRTTIVRPLSKSLNKSSQDLRKGTQSATPRPIVINHNPTRQQKGLLRIINSADSGSRIPVASNWASLDDLTLKKRLLRPMKNRRRSSSTSPERRSSTLTASDRRSSNLSSVTTSDFSYRRGSTSPLRATLSSRRKSIFGGDGLTVDSGHFMQGNKSQRKVAKPTTLSPIIGTPNKDSPQSSDDSRLTRRGSLSKIPVRDQPSRSSSRVGSKANSRDVSRSTSPSKTYGPVSRSSSRADTSRSPSRTTIRAESRATSRAESRPTSRSDSRNNSRSGSRAEQVVSRLTSRPTSKADNSRTGYRATSLNNSRRTSRPNIRAEQPRFSFRSRSSPTRKNQSRSPAKSPTKSRYSSSPPKSGSRHSPSKGKHISPRLNRRMSVSPTSKRRETRSRSQGRKSPTRRDSRSRIPLMQRKKSLSVSPPKSNLNRVSPKRTSQRMQQPVRAKKSPAPIKRPQGSTMKTPSSVRKETDDQKRSKTKPEPMSGKKPTTTMQKEASKLSLKQTPATETSQLQKEPSRTELKREASSMTLKSSGSKASLLKKRTDSNLSKKLEKKGSFRAEKPTSAASTSAGKTSEAAVMEEVQVGATSSEISKANIRAKLIARSKANVMSLTVAALTPRGTKRAGVGGKAMSAGGAPADPAAPDPSPAPPTGGEVPTISAASNEDMTLPAAILEKSQKTLETIQKTVTEATQEIHKTINENLTDLKSLESDIGKMAEDGGTPVPFEKSDSLKTIKENSTKSTSEKHPTVDQAENSPQPPSQPIEASVSVLKGKKSSDNLLVPDVSNGASSSGTPGNVDGTGMQHQGDMSERVSERAISVLPEVECESANLQNYENGTTSDMNDGKGLVGTGQMTQDGDMQTGSGNGEHHDDGSKRSGSQEFLKEPEDEPTGCCKCCATFCIPCRRCRCSKCSRKRPDSETTAVISEEVDEKVSCWKRMKCCKKKSATRSEVDSMGPGHMETIAEETSVKSSTGPKQGKCGLCLSKVFCCRATNKVEATTGDTEETKRCCFCIPCRKKKVAGTSSISGSQPAWQEGEIAESILSDQPEEPKEGCCTRFMNKLKCWKKKPQISESRRASMKQSNAPTEDTRSKLHVDLVEFNSKMKGAIPVMPLYLAWFCAICNTLVPGLGTVLSGFFCLCVGIPRFSPYDSAKARFGSLFVNCIVGAAQLFCVLFCLVGWGWSIWWGTIMLKTARKLNKIKRVEKLELEEEQRQAAIAAEAGKQKPVEKDVEAGKA